VTSRLSDHPEAGLHHQVPSGIHIVSSRLRSVNLERDSETADIRPIHLSARVLGTVSRLSAAIDDPARTRAWSLTGPYGSGKSTIALLVTALLGPAGNRRRQAEALIAEESPDLAQRIAAARDHMAPEGFITAIAVARREPVTETLARALIRGANRRWPDGKPPRRVATSLKPLRSPAAASAEILAALEALCGEGPILLVIDEFGKTLEYLAGGSDTGTAHDDVFILQEIAELGAGQSGLPVFTLTLQHLSFLDYAARSTTLQRREWAKVQGRFEDITFMPDLSDAVQLIRRSLTHEDLDDAGHELIRRHAAASCDAWSRLGLQGVLPADAGLFATLYPLHPLTAAAAPLVAAQVGQHDRSLTGFLAGDEPHTIERFITTHGTADATRATTVRLPQLYDYFFASGRTTMLASASASRWIEIDLILSQAHGMDDQDLQILKTIGILNLIDASGALRACQGTVLFALTDPVGDNDDGARKALLTRLQNLAERGFLVYRAFSDEFRLWQGTDIDLRARIGEARERCDDHAVVKMLAGQLPGAVVAGRHSQRTGMLRHFITAATDPGTDVLTGPGVNDPADGILAFHFGDQHDLPEVRSLLPVVVGTSKNAAAVLDAGREVIALNELLATKDLDAVARREIAERAGQARTELAAAMARAFGPGQPGARWQLINADDAGGDATDLTARGLSGIVSAACDVAYPHTPHIRNEMLGRHQLTSQGAKARRELITAMLTRGSSSCLGITGYGPERAIYHGVLAYLGLHEATPGHHAADGSGRYHYAEPEQNTTLNHAWTALRAALAQATRERPVDELFQLLMAPPYGVKSGVVPVIIVAVLLMTRDEVAVFEEGTYQPSLTPDLIERLIKAPDRYSIKYVPVGGGQRHLALEQVAEELGITPALHHPSHSRNPALLAVTRELLNQMRSLSAYAARTQRLSSHAITVRRALTAARDPDELLFTALPQALDLQPIQVLTERSEDLAAEYASRLSAAISEIRAADAALRTEVTRILAREFRVPEDIPALRQTLAARVAVFEDEVHEPELRGFIALALNDGLPDDDWLDPVAVRIIRSGLASWTDGHLRQFEEAARKLATALDRLAHLYDPGSATRHTTDGEVQLLTVTSHDGHEGRVLVHIPSTVRDTAARLAADVAAAADQQLGADGRRILLAALARVALGARSPGQDDELHLSADRAPSLKETD
jgi:hypothetical protein